MSTQPTALRLADALEQQFPIGTAQNYLDGEAAAELRRLHKVHMQTIRDLADADEENEKLREVNAELLAALDYVIRDLELRSNLKRGDEWGEIDIGHGAYMQAKAVIAKATGENNE